MTFIECPNCGTYIEEQSAKNGYGICPKCGAELYGIDKAEKNNTGNEYKEKRRPRIGCLVSILIIVALICVGIWYYRIDNYKANLHNTIYYIIDSTDELDEAGCLYLNVWNATENKWSDEETDKYSKDGKGKFYRDYHDALDSLTSDSDYKKIIRKAEQSKDKASELIVELVNPPKRYVEAYSNLKILYANYLAFYNIVMNPSGNYASYSKKFDDARDKLLESYYSVSMY